MCLLSFAYFSHLTKSLHSYSHFPKPKRLIHLMIRYLMISMYLDKDLELVEEDLKDLEELDRETSSPDQDVRYLRVGYPSSGGFPGSNLGGSTSEQQLRAPRKPSTRNKPRGKAPKGWNRAKRSGRHYHGFYLHTWCDCMLWGSWFCFCLDEENEIVVITRLIA